MLLVLGVLMLSVTAAAIAARAIASSRMTESTDLLARSCDELARTSRYPIRDWLERRSRTVVIGPHAEQPRVAILHDRWDVGDRTCELIVTAWDQCGMVSVSAAASGHPLARVLPDRIRDHAKDLPRSWLEHPGVDQLEVDGLPLFAGSGCPGEGFEDAVTPYAGGSSNGVAVAAVVATHNPPIAIRSRRGPPPMWINVNTSPAPLLEEALRLAGMGGLDGILEARAAGAPATMSLVVASGDAQQSTPIRFVSASSAWGVRVDARVGGVRRSWWEVWVSTSGHWELVQRLPINE